MRRLALAIVGLLLAAAVAAALLLGDEGVRASEPGSGPRGDLAGDRSQLSESAAATPSAGRLETAAESAPASLPTGPTEAELAAAALVVRGLVVDSARRPVAGAAVRVVRAFGSDGAKTYEAAAASDGRFVVPVPSREGWGWRVEARAPGFAPSLLCDLPLSVSEVDVGALVLHPPVALRGRVVSRDGLPIARARIYATTLLDQRDQEDLWLSTEEPRPLAETSADGSFAIAALPPGKIAFGAEAPGFADTVRPGVLIGPGKTNEVDFTMAPEEPFSGTVVDVRDSPVARAQVLAWRDGARFAFWRRPLETDASGRFSIPGIDRLGRGMGVQVRKLGYSQVWSDGAHLPPDGRFVLGKAARVLVRAQRAGGPAPAIRAVRFESRRGSGRWNGGGEVPRSQREEIEPSVWLASTEIRGRVRVAVTAVDGCFGASNEFDIPKDPSSPLEVSVALEAPGSVAGRVVASNLSALEGVRLELAPVDGSAPRVAVSGAGGSFRFDGLAPGAGLLAIRCKDWLGEPARVEVRAGERLEGLEVLARKPSSVSGRLRVGDAPPGEPVPITAFRVDTEGGGTQWQFLGIATTDERGEFRFAPAPAGRIAFVPKRRIDAEEGGVRNFERETPHPYFDDQARDAWPHIVEVAPESEARIEIRVADPRPALVRGQVLVNGEPRPGIDLWMSATKGGEWYSETTNAEGRFRFRVDAAGEYLVQIWGDGFNDQQRLSVSEGEERELRFELQAGGIEGSLTDEGGRPLAIRVRLERQKDPNQRRGEGWNGWWDRPEQLAKADGTYRFPEVVAGKYRIVVDDSTQRHAVMATALFDVGPKERYSVPPIRVPLAAPLLVTARSPEGRALAGRAVVTAAPGSEPLARTSVAGFPNPKGMAQILGLRPGPVLVRFHTNGPWDVAEKVVDLPATGAPTTVSLEGKRKDGVGGDAPGAGASSSIDLGFIGNEPQVGESAAWDPNDFSSQDFPIHWVDDSDDSDDGG